MVIHALGKVVFPTVVIFLFFPCQAQAESTRTRCSVIGGVFQGLTVISPWRQERCVTTDTATGEVLGARMCSYDERNGASDCKDSGLTYQEEAQNKEINSRREAQNRPSKTPPRATKQNHIQCFNYITAGGQKKCID